MSGAAPSPMERSGQKEERWRGCLAATPSGQEVAARLGVPLDTIRTGIRNGRRRLREALGSRGLAEGSNG